MNDKRTSGSEQIQSALLKLDDVMHDFRTTVTLDGERLSQLHVSEMAFKFFLYYPWTHSWLWLALAHETKESLVKGREKAEDTFREEQRKITEERAVIDQWRENINRELTNRKSEIEKKEVEVHDREHDVAHRELIFRQQMEHENASAKSEQEELKEMQRISTEQEEELKGQRRRIDMQFEEMDTERRRLQNIAEQLSLLSETLAQKADVAEGTLFKAEQMTRESEEKDIDLSAKHNEIEEKTESIKREKMELARQRVEFLKEKSHSRQHTALPGKLSY